MAAYLSGGIDSGSVTAVAAEQLPYLRTFTVGFDLHSASGLEMGMDERREAEDEGRDGQRDHDRDHTGVLGGPAATSTA